MKAPDKLPDYALIVRWGGFSLNIVGRGALLAWAASVVTALGALGLRHYFSL